MGKLTKEELKRVQLILDTKLYNQLIRYVAQKKEDGTHTSNSETARKAIRMFLNEVK